MLPHMDNLSSSTIVGRSVDGGKQVISLDSVKSVSNEIYVGV